MKIFFTVINGISVFLNNLAGILFVLLMVLVTVNVILRSVFSAPLMGAFEYAGYGTALAISLSMALCTLKDGHIAITFIADRLFPKKFVAILSTVVNFVSAAFFTYVGWHVSAYAAEMAAKGVVSATTRTPFYPYIYVVSICFFIMAIVLVYKTIASFAKEDVTI